MPPDRRVYVPNKSYHDFADAERFGKLIFLTSGMVRRLHINQLYRECSEGMKDAQEDDYLLVSSLAILNAICASILAHKFGKVNFLMWSPNGYVARTVNLQIIPKDVENDPLGHGQILTAGRYNDEDEDGKENT